MDRNRTAVVLLAEDNPAEQRLAERALGQGVIECDLRIVSDGEEALHYLRRQGAYAEANTAPTPDLVLLDLNMPKIDGRQVLEEMRSDPQLKSIPVVILTTSKAERDVLESYRLGCNSFLNKPVAVAEFVDLLQSLGQYWLKLVVLPSRTSGASSK